MVAFYDLLPDRETYADDEEDDKECDHHTQRCGVVVRRDLPFLVHAAQDGEQAPVERRNREDQRDTREDQGYLVGGMDDDHQEHDEDQFCARNPVDQVFYKVMDFRIDFGFLPSVEDADGVGIF